MCNNHTVALLHLPSENTLAGIFLRVEHHGRTLEVPELGSHASGLHHAAVLCNITEEDSHTAIFGVGMLDVSDAPVLTVGIETLVIGFLSS